jgi:hypothetical protein
MPATLKVRSDDASVKAQRESAAQRVLAYFVNSLPPSRLLCFLDDHDPPDLRQQFGNANRGVYGPIDDSTPLAIWPDYVKDCIYVDDGVSFLYPRAVDDLIYLYGSTCANEVGLTMTLAHELQHAIQHANFRKVWAVNSLVTNLARTIIDEEKLQWADIPTEREARIASKRAAEYLLGEDPVRHYIDGRIAEPISEADAADWQFVRTLTDSSAVDLVGDTQQLFKRLKNYRPELEAVLQEKKGNPDFGDIDLDVYFGGTASQR